MSSVDRVGLAVDVAGLVLGRPADLEQRLLEVPALRTGARSTVSWSIRVPSIGAIFLCRRISSSTARSRETMIKPVRGVRLQHQPAVAAHGVDDVDQQRLRDREPGPPDQRVDHLLGVVPGGAGVPQRERRDPVGVDVLGGAFQLGERCDVGAGRRGIGVGDLQQQRLVGLDDQRSVGHAGSSRGETSGRTGPDSPLSNQERAMGNPDKVSPRKRAAAEVAIVGGGATR